MTNSTPKMINKIERQGSPNNGSSSGGGGGKRQNQRNNNNNNNNNANAIKTSTYFPSVSRQQQIRNTNGGGRNSCSPPACQQSKSRGSPLRQQYQNESPRGSPTNSFYAGAKFSEPPSPASLPKPPSHWTTRLMSTCKQQSDHCRDISNHLKMILNVQA